MLYMFVIAGVGSLGLHVMSFPKGKGENGKRGIGKFKREEKRTDDLWVKVVKPQGRPPGELDRGKGALRSEVLRARNGLSGTPPRAATPFFPWPDDIDVRSLARLSCGIYMMLKRSG